MTAPHDFTVDHNECDRDEHLRRQAAGEDCLTDVCLECGRPEAEHAKYFDDTHVEVPYGPGWTVYRIGTTEARFDGDVEAVIESCHLDSPDETPTTVATIALTFRDDPHPANTTRHTVGVELTAGDCRTLIDALQRVLEMEERL